MTVLRAAALTAATALMMVGTVGGATAADDTVRPIVTLDPAPAVFNSTALDLVVRASDDVELARIVGNVYSGSTLVRSTQSAASGTAGTHVVDLDPLTDGAYTLRYNALDAAGNVAQTKTFAFTVDNTRPTVTVKAAPESVSSAGRYRTVGFKLFDAGQIDKVVLNGVTKDLSNNLWSDVNGVRPGVFGAVEGSNTLIVHDVAGNTTTVTFVLDTTGPTITVKPESVGADGTFSTVSFKLHDLALVDRVELNGVVKNLTDNVWSDVNGVVPGVFGAVEGLNTLVAFDALGNSSTFTFTLAPVAPSSTEPSTSEPSTSEPSTTEPSSTEPSTTDPSSTEPSTTEPSTEPSTSEPSSTEPSTTEPSSTEPTISEPTTSATEGPDSTTESSSAAPTSEDPADPESTVTATTTVQVLEENSGAAAPDTVPAPTSSGPIAPPVAQVTTQAALAHTGVADLSVAIGLAVLLIGGGSLLLVARRA